MSGAIDFADPLTSFVIVIGVVAGFRSACRSGGLSRQISGSTRSIATSALIGVRRGRDERHVRPATRRWSRRQPKETDKLSDA